MTTTLNSYTNSPRPSFLGYVNGTNATAVYPGAGTPDGMIYLAFGVNGESAELLEAINDGTQNDVMGELGDVLWYLAQVKYVLDLPVDEWPIVGGRGGREHMDAVVIHAGGIAEVMKKTLRENGGQLTPERREKVAAHVQGALDGLASVASSYGWDIAQVAGMNLAKLGGRKANGTLHGDGNYR